MVILYSKPGCGQCIATKRALDKQGTSYTYLDVSQDEQAYGRVLALGYQQVPVVEAGDEHWSGFRPDRIKAL